MKKKRRQVKLLTTGGVRGTGNILQDLISSTVRLQRVQVTGGQSGLEAGQSSLSTRNETCSICGDISVGCQPLTQKEIEIVEELVLPSFATSSPCGVTYLCHSCSSTLSRLTKLRQEIQDLIQCLRAVVKIHRNKSKDNEGAKSIQRIQPQDCPIPANWSQSEAKEMEVGQEEDVDFVQNSNVVDIKTERADPEDDHDRLDLDLDGMYEPEIDVKPTLQTWEQADPLLNNDQAEDMAELKEKRKSRVRAEELLHLMTQNGDYDAAQVGQDRNEESDSNYGESESDIDSEPDIRQDFAGSTKKFKKEWTSTEPLECVVCEEKFEDPETLELHKSQHSKDKCEICNLAFENEQDYDLHFLSQTHYLGKTTRRNENHSDDAGNEVIFACNQCTNSFDSVMSLLSHIKTDHGVATTQNYCELCNKWFKFGMSMKRHLLSDYHAEKVGGEKAVADLEAVKHFQCEICDKRFMRNDRLERHIKEFHEKKKGPCHICKKQLATLTAFRYHMRHFHPGEPLIIPDRFIPPQDKWFECNQCSSRFADRTSLHRHLRKTHGGPRYKCDLCSKDFVSPRALSGHKETAHGDESGLVASNKRTKNNLISCVFCLKSFGKKGLRIHLEMVHFADKSACPFGCPDKIDNAQEWFLHLEQCKSEKMSELSIGSHFCLFCQETFSNIILRIVHHHRLHTSYPCSHCEESFTQQDILQRHTAKHVETEGHLCPKCGRKFNRKENLKRHSKTCGISN